ncbi:hypothetical protein [Flavobacterium psychrophilum]|uniref:hypothetical protein n=1 Tax=Flavobacterium psychrophilum TaxID=96345 RepID=UPI000B7C3E79|nr:hypothetical protein [Flavobacterium psychrophilum]MCB6089133.1 hypothetical protein [Flavobacterium psychrophilum]MCB6231832.1 hypothetical protein [Flavobacterium psychrophilum]MEB3380334.1 hypothetical protein [Flavobacterium psychrophilum]SNA77850.1 hypothetical protein DK095_460198 [Flavobacterium psychrophilum]SNA87976.1 hypothetical protein FI146_70020 [Flavobacterium psychrophilum]
MKNPVFEANPSLDCYFETADGTAFFTENAANNHAKTLKDKTVKAVHNTNTSADDNTNTDTELEAKVKELESTELVKENYKVLKDLVKYFQIDTVDQKAETLIVALTEYKLKLQA